MQGNKKYPYSKIHSANRLQNCKENKYQVLKDMRTYFLPQFDLLTGISVLQHYPFCIFASSMAQGKFLFLATTLFLFCQQFPTSRGEPTIRYKTFCKHERHTTNKLHNGKKAIQVSGSDRSHKLYLTTWLLAASPPNRHHLRRDLATVFLLLQGILPSHPRP